MTDRSLKIFEQVTSATRVSRRLKDLLKNPESDHEEGWHMAVPSCFNDALDIRLNFGVNRGWTQSGCFAFKQGDVLYDTPRAYTVWSEALQHINLSLQITAASPAGEAKGGGRTPGTVTCDFFSPNRDRTQLVRRGTHSMTQDDLVRMLIVGPPDDLAHKIEEAQQEDRQGR